MATACSLGSSVRSFTLQRPALLPCATAVGLLQHRYNRRRSIGCIGKSSIRSTTSKTTHGATQQRVRTGTELLCVSTAHILPLQLTNVFHHYGTSTRMADSMARAASAVFHMSSWSPLSCKYRIFLSPSSLQPCASSAFCCNSCCSLSNSVSSGE